jgi:hypothetical protein
MTVQQLVARLRALSVRLRVVDGVLQVAPHAVLTDGDRAAIREQLAEVKALVQAEADGALIASVFGDGIRVVSSGPAGPWPPEGAWLPPPARTIDLYAAEAPTAPCPCGALDWHKPAGNSGWLCGMCRPPPDRSVGSAAGPIKEEQ